MQFRWDKMEENATTSTTIERKHIYKMPENQLKIDEMPASSAHCT